MHTDNFSLAIVFCLTMLKCTKNKVKNFTSQQTFNQSDTDVNVVAKSKFDIQVDMFKERISTCTLMLDQEELHFETYVNGRHQKGKKVKKNIDCC